MTWLAPVTRCPLIAAAGQPRTLLNCRQTLRGLVADAADARKPSTGIEYVIDGSTVSQWFRRDSRRPDAFMPLPPATPARSWGIWVAWARWRAVQRLLLYV